MKRIKKVKEKTLYDYIKEALEEDINDLELDIRVDEDIMKHGVRKLEIRKYKLTMLKDELSTLVFNGELK